MQQGDGAGGSETDGHPSLSVTGDSRRVTGPDADRLTPSAVTSRRREWVRPEVSDLEKRAYSEGLGEGDRHPEGSDLEGRGTREPLEWKAGTQKFQASTGRAHSDSLRERRARPQVSDLEEAGHSEGLGRDGWARPEVSDIEGKGTHRARGSLNWSGGHSEVSGLEGSVIFRSASDFSRGVTFRTSGRDGVGGTGLSARLCARG